MALELVKIMYRVKRALFLCSVG